MAVRVPQPVSVETAIRIYYEKSEIGNADIKRLFGSIGKARIVGLKDLAREVMIESGCKVWDASCVSTKCAYKSWGMDITDLENRFDKLKKLERKMS